MFQKLDLVFSDYDIDHDDIDPGKSFFTADTFKKYKIKTNPNMYILMYFEIQSDQPRTTRNAFKKHFVLFLVDHFEFLSTSRCTYLD